MRYAAFLSYAHKDAKIARKLHRKLEHYALPKTLGQDAKRKLSPIFMDRAELSAASNLSDPIRDALHASPALIILCSPAAKASHWVNEEIRLFRECRGDDGIFCALVEGTPETSFPPALLETGREPLAADLSRSNIRHGVHQLAAALLQIDLDELLRRDAQRLRRRVTAITAGASAIVLVMAGLTMSAVQSRNLAEQRRVDAEGLIEFMLTDLKDKLDAVGRLDALEAVGDRAADYYEGYPVQTHNDDALARRANVFTYLGEIQDKLGNPIEAERYFRQAYQATDRLLAGSPDEAERIFDHAQSAFWRGYYHYNLEEYEDARGYYADYLSLAEKLAEIDGNDNRARQESAYALTNMGAVELALGNIEPAKQYYGDALTAKEDLLAIDPDNIDRIISVANAHAHLADMSLQEGDTAKAISNWKAANQIIRAGLASAPEDARLFHQDLIQLRSLARLFTWVGDQLSAEQYIEMGQEQAGAILARDPTNVTIRYEKSLIDMIELESLLSSGRLDQADQTFDVINTDLAAFPKAFRDDFRYKVLQTSAQTLSLYRAILSGQETAKDEQSVAAKSTLADMGVFSDEGLGNQPYALALFLLVHLAQPDEATQSVLRTTCTGTASWMNSYHKALLSGVPPDPSCPNADAQSFETFTHIARQRMQK